MLKMITYFKDDARRINHALKVYGFAKAICGDEHVSENEEIIIELAAILHDIGIKEAEKKYNSTAGKYQEIEGPPIARQIFIECNTPNDILERVCFLIGNHHSYQKIDGIDFQILVEADFIVNIYEDDMQRTAIEGIRNKYFKTSTGRKILDSMYLT
jgi:hypothetical protein